jgi:ribosomal protein S18 acetylase RimI-like enzyme
MSSNDMKFREGKIAKRLWIERNGKMIEILLRFPRKEDAAEIWRFYEKAKKELKLELLTLSVYSHNKIAQKLYKILGFRKTGILPRGAKRKGKYFDDITMYKVLGI